MAAKMAAEELREKILNAFAKALDCAVEDIDFDGTVAEGGGKEMTLVQLAHQAVARVGTQQMNGFASFCSPVSPPPFMVGFAEVKVDIETGKVTPVDFVGAVDCGTVINPALAKVQTEGGIVQGIGMALYEEVRYNSRGAMETNNFMIYKIPTRKDTGNIRVDFVESYEPTGPFGAKSIGEVVINPIAPAIQNAIDNAVGVHLGEPPYIPERVYMAMQKKKE